MDDNINNRKFILEIYFYETKEKQSYEFDTRKEAVSKMKEEAINIIMDYGKCIVTSILDDNITINYDYDENNRILLAIF